LFKVVETLFEVAITGTMPRYGNGVEFSASNALANWSASST
jgi:hypothetical protein